jgi:hypothetical protein
LALPCFTWRGTVLGPDEWESNVVGYGHGGLLSSLNIVNAYFLLTFFRLGRLSRRLFGLLVRRYVDPVIALGIIRLFNERRCLPPLDDNEVDRICNDIARREAAQVRGRG